MNLWRCIAICHDVLSINLPGSIKPTLSGASQDEIQLLQAGEGSGIVNIISRNTEKIKIKINGTVEEYKILKVYEFTSERKMMSVIVKRESDNKIFIFTKGADEKLVSLASSS